jgi:hypothetical protein
MTVVLMLEPANECLPVAIDVGGAGGEYSTENLLGPPEMIAEHYRQKQMLTA